MTAERTTIIEKYLNFTKFWNKLKTSLSKPRRHQSKRLNNKNIVAWFRKTLKRPLNNEAILQKRYKNENYEKKRKPEKKDNSNNLFF